MTDIETLFFQLVSVAIGIKDSLSRQPSEQEWRMLYLMAEKQSLVGICFAGIQNLGADADEGFARVGIDEMQYLKWMGMAAKIQQRNEQVDRQCIELQARLAADGFRSCVLKGQGIAQLYGRQLAIFRQSGDIDIWIDGDRKLVMDYVNARTPNREFDMKHTHYEVFQDTVVETHWRPAFSKNPIMNRKLTAYFEKESSRQFANVVELSGNLKICTPTVDFQLVHTMLHVYGHFLYEGVGMRQMMDLYFAQRACGADMRSAILSTLRKFGLMRFIGATQYVMREVFGMSEEDLLCAADVMTGKELLGEIMLGGNFGYHSKENKVKNESFAQRMVRHLKRRLRLVRFDPVGMMFAPVGKLRILLWKRIVIKKYNL